MAKETAEKVMRNMGEVLKGLKGVRKQAGLGRKLSPPELHSNALKKFVNAMLDSDKKRGWKKVSTGKYVLGKHTVQTHDDHKIGFHVIVDGDILHHLGKGCIAELDKYVKDMDMTK